MNASCWKVLQNHPWRDGLSMPFRPGNGQAQQSIAHLACAWLTTVIGGAMEGPDPDILLQAQLLCQHMTFLRTSGVMRHHHDRHEILWFNL